MPILNAAITSWSVGHIAYPFIDPTTDTVQWGTTDIILDYLKINRVTDRSLLSIIRGGPYPNVWKMGDAIWEIEFKTPMLVPFYQNPDTGKGGYFDQFTGVCATLPLTQITGETWFKPLIMTGFVAAALRPILFLTSPDSIKKYWNDVDSHVYDRDIIVTNVTVSIGEDESSLTVKLLSTANPRELFYLSDQILTETELDPIGRVTKPFDVYITDEYLGGQIVISEPQGVKAVPTYLPTFLSYEDYMLTAQITSTGEDEEETPAPAYEGGFGEAGSPGYVFMPRSLQISVNCETFKKRSIGVPSARPLIISDAVSVSGSMTLVPFYRDEYGNMMHTDPSFVAPTDPSIVPYGINQPAGWMADVQAMDDLELSDRPPGKYYRSFEKSPTAETSKPLFFGFAMKDGLGSWPFWGIDGKSPITPLGAASIKQVASSQQAGQFHELTVEFTTDPQNLS